MGYIYCLCVSPDLKKTQGSKGYEKARLKIAEFHGKPKDTRIDFRHKLSTKIICENQTIVLKDLNVSRMVKNRKLSRAISETRHQEIPDIFRIDLQENMLRIYSNPRIGRNRYNNNN
jgi:Transposase and inactivated derivatives